MKTFFLPVGLILAVFTGVAFPTLAAPLSGLRVAAWGPRTSCVICIFLASGYHAPAAGLPFWTPVFCMCCPLPWPSPCS